MYVGAQEYSIVDTMLTSFGNGENVRCLQCGQNLVASDRASTDVSLLHDGFESALAETGRYQSRGSMSRSEVLTALVVIICPIFLTKDSTHDRVHDGIFARKSERLTLDDVPGEGHWRR